MIIAQHVLLTIILLFVSPLATAIEKKISESDYVGAKACKGCHINEYQQWRQSDHHKAMQVATDETVLGDFSGVTVNFHNIKSRLYQKDSRFLIDTADKTGKQKTFEIKYTFGFDPLQQYLVETHNGHIQALNIAWDSRNKTEGGQRWFHLRPEENISTEHPFYWSRYFQNWNSRCAQCHSTNVVRNYNRKTHSYNTTWSQINVACEACHGPGSRHVALAQKKTLSEKNTGFSSTLHKPLSWQFKQGDAIAHSRGEKNLDEINRCGSCHSLRTSLTNKTAGEDFFENYRLQLLNQGEYFDDGQIREEVFVLGSFLQSKMHKKGVTCSNCHNPHTGKVLIEGNGLCNQCHVPDVFDTPKHHHHVDNTSGATCVNCHMPSRTYMQVDERRDHSFSIPRADLSLDLQVPNACVSCHAKKVDNGNKKDKQYNDLWANKIMSGWRVKPNNDHWAYLNQRARNTGILVTQDLIKQVEKDELADIVRASLLQQLANMPSQASVEAAQKALQDDSSLVRRAAVSALAQMPPALRWQLLSSHLMDTSRPVRYQIADTLADILNQLPADKQTGLAKIIEQYRDSLRVTLDSPSTQLTIASLEVRLGNMVAAQQAYLQALRIEPNYVPALINLADYYRAINRESESEPLLKKALSVAPGSGAVHHSYGLFLARQQNYDKALSHLKMAVQQADAQPHYAYVYAVALDHKGQTDNAITVLVNANNRWPNHYDVLITLVQYLDKVGKTLSVHKYLSALTAIAPDSNEVKRLLEKFR